MRTLLLAGLGAALAIPAAADAQRVVQHGPGAAYPMPGRPMPGRTVGPGRPMAPPMVHPGPRPTMHPVMHPTGGRWGSKVGGRWWGGANAPGGWSAYRRPYRGYALPTYWVAPRFFINDWQGYGLSQPSAGYNWVRYYDDAVLIDGRGSVYDTRDGVDWDGMGFQDGGDRDDDGGYADGRVYAGPDDQGYARRDDGLGGAAIGAVAGGVAGNLIAGRGNRLGGTLIGAGVGAGVGYAVDKAEDGGRRPPRPPVAPYGAAPPPPGYPADMHGHPPRPMAHAPGGHWVSPDGTTTVTTTGSGSYASGGYYYPGGTTTTVVVQSAPVVTTTTTEVYEDSVTYTRKPVRLHRWKPRAKPRCSCR